MTELVVSGSSRFARSAPPGARQVRKPCHLRLQVIAEPALGGSRFPRRSHSVRHDCPRDCGQCPSRMALSAPVEGRLKSVGEVVQRGGSRAARACGVIGAVLLLAACQGPGALPVVATSPGLSQPSSPVLLPTGTQGPTEGSPSVSPGVPTPGCAAPQTKWKQVNALMGFQIHDGYMANGPCGLLLAGEETSGGTYTGVLLWSPDGGEHFTVAATFDRGSRLWRIIRADSHHAWAVGTLSRDGIEHGLILESTDGGNHWREANGPPVDELSVLAASSGRVWVAGTCCGTPSSAVILTSTDDGGSWEEVARLPPQADRFARLQDMAVSFPTVVAVGEDGTQGIVLISRDDGKSFVRSPISTRFSGVTGVALIDQHEAFVTGYFAPSGRLEDPQSKGMLIHTVDGGASWENVVLPDNHFVGNILFTSRQRGFCIATTGAKNELTVFSTKDAGQTWVPMRLSPSPEFFLERLFPGDGESVYAVGGSGLYSVNP